MSRAPESRIVAMSRKREQGAGEESRELGVAAKILNIKEEQGARVKSWNREQGAGAGAKSKEPEPEQRAESRSKKPQTEPEQEQ